MPCQDWDDTGRPTNGILGQRWMDAALCAVLAAHMKAGTFADLMATVDWAEAGITEAQLRSWWDEHQRSDAARRAWEARQGAKP